jgi:hypothetical protein
LPVSKLWIVFTTFLWVVPLEVVSCWCIIPRGTVHVHWPLLSPVVKFSDLCNAELTGPFFSCSYKIFWKWCNRMNLSIKIQLLLSTSLYFISYSNDSKHQICVLLSWTVGYSCSSITSKLLQAQVCITLASGKLYIMVQHYCDS